MPIYEYECAGCGRIAEAIQKFSDKPLKTCSACSGKLHRLISQSSFHLKGTGWYVTDYADKTPKNSKTPPDGAKAPSAPENTSKPPDTDSKKTDKS